MAFKYSITALYFSDGTRIQLTTNDIVVFVGPNNAGKSAALRELVALLDAPARADVGTKVLKKIDVEIGGDQADFDQFLNKLEQHPTNPLQVGRMGALLPRQTMSEMAGNVNWVRQHLRQFCTYHVTTESRLSVTNPVDSIDLLTQPKSHPFHYLYDDYALESDLSTVFAKAFGSDLIVNRTAGGRVHLHVGVKPSPYSPFAVSPEYRLKLMQMPALDKQGDGMRAFVGSLLFVAVVDYPIVLIDEPEAFLHPPQARLMGRTLVRKKREGRQLFLATHSGDFLRGVLDGQPKSVRILRIVRSNDVNVVKELNTEQITELWADPILRQSNPLDGLFHSLVVLCESDADSQFYSGIAHALADAESERTSPDAMFIHCGGKARMPKVLRALKSVGVPVQLIVDFDVLREEQPLRELIEALGHDWSQYAADWKLLNQAISSQRAQLDVGEFKERMQRTLGKLAGTVVQDDVLTEIRELSRKASAWAYAKRGGESFVPAGEPVKAYRRIAEKAATIGLQIVPVGELESFAKSVSLHGPAWVLEMMKRDLLNDGELEAARAFVKPLIWTS